MADELDIIKQNSLDRQKEEAKIAENMPYYIVSLKRRLDMFVNNYGVTIEKLKNRIKVLEDAKG